MAIFGLAFGETPPSSFNLLNENFAYSDIVPAPHPSFSNYYCFFNTAVGIAKIGANSVPFENDEYGEKAIAAFETVQSQLSKKYGTPEHRDILNEGSIWSEPRDWASSILHGERTYFSIWTDSSSNLRDGIESILLSIKAADGGHELSLVYESKDWQSVLDEIQDRQGDVL